MGEKMKIVYSYVVADLLHVGHILALENAKKLFGDCKLVVGVLTDESVMEKKPKPTLSFSERRKLVESLKCVDVVVAQDTYSPINNLNTIRPDVIMESDSHSEEDLKKTRKAAELIGCKVQVMPYFPEQSSTKIKDKIKNGRKKTGN